MRCHDRTHGPNAFIGASGDSGIEENSELFCCCSVVDVLIILGFVPPTCTCVTCVAVVHRTMSRVLRLTTAVSAAVDADDRGSSGQCDGLPPGLVI